MRVAVTGVSGFIGAEIARQLHGRGHSVSGLVRQSSRRDHIERYVDRFVVGDQADREAWPALLDGADAVIHASVDWACLGEKPDLARHLHANLNGSIELLHASGSRPFVFLSTIAVHHDMRPRWRGNIDEDHPLRPGMLYGAYKAAVEPHLWERHFKAGVHTVAVRPCGVYGIDPNLERSHGYKLIQKLRRGERFERAGGGKFVHVEDVAVATVNAITSPEAAGRPYNLVDCYARWADWARIGAELLGVDVKIDMSSPAHPKNTFSKEAARELGVSLDRGHDGIRTHLRELIQRMDHE